MQFDPTGSMRPNPGEAVIWKDVAPRGPRDNPVYAMYKDVLDAIARLVGEDVS
jgi:hypothetical protein